MEPLILVALLLEGVRLVEPVKLVNQKTGRTSESGGASETGGASEHLTSKNTGCQLDDWTIFIANIS